MVFRIWNFVPEDMRLEKIFYLIQLGLTGLFLALFNVIKKIFRVVFLKVKINVCLKKGVAHAEGRSRRVVMREILKMKWRENSNKFVSSRQKMFKNMEKLLKSKNN